MPKLNDFEIKSIIGLVEQELLPTLINSQPVIESAQNGFIDLDTLSQMVDLNFKVSCKVIEEFERANPDQYPELLNHFLGLEDFFKTELLKGLASNIESIGIELRLPLITQ